LVISDYNKLRSCSSNIAYGAKLELHATIDGPKRMSENKNSSLQRLDNCKSFILPGIATPHG